MTAGGNEHGGGSISGGSRPGLLARGLMGLVYVYQVTLGPFVGGRCRFYPSCSAYAAEALATHGALRGALLTVRRLSRCHPLGGHGVDLVPPAKGRAR